MIFVLLIIFQSVFNLHFDLQQGKKRCIMEELYLNNMAMIKYSVNTLMPGKEEEMKTFYNSINIRATLVNDPTNTPIDTYLNQGEGKISFTAKVEGQYKICVFLFPSSWEPKDRVTMNLIIMSDNMDEPDLNKALKKEEVDELHDKVEEILRKGKTYLDHQEYLMAAEDHDSKSIIKMQKIFYYLTLVQIIIVIGLGIYQVRNLKKYLDDNVLDLY